MTAFIIEEFSHKQHINLSDEAYEIINDDLFSFYYDNKRHLSTYLNQVISNYYELSTATLSRLSWKLTDEYTELLSKDFKNDEKLNKEIIELLVNNDLKKAYQQATSYPLGKGYKFRLNDDNYETFNTEDTIESNQFYTFGKYIKAIVEEFTRLNYVTREKIFFKDTVKQINEAIESNNIIKMTIQVSETEERVYYVRPYKIVTDSSNLYNYLVGKQSDKLIGASSYIDGSFRLSKIKSIKKIDKSNFISKAEKDKLDYKLSTNGVQFLLRDSEEIIVRLTPKGEKQYKSMQHLRPNFTSVDGSDYHFLCSPDQIEFYFFKFGPEATIIAPKKLALKFKNKYSKSLSNYSDI